MNILLRNIYEVCPKIVKFVCSKIVKIAATRSVFAANISPKCVDGWENYDAPPRPLVH